MRMGGRLPKLASAWFAWWLLSCLAGDVCWGQFFNSRPILSIQAVQLEEVGNVPKKLLEQAQGSAATDQWEACFDALRHATDDYGNQLIPDGPGRHVKLRDYCQKLISQLPADGVAHYRKRYDPQAEQWLLSWKKTGDADSLEKVVRLAFNTNFGDDALDLLAENALEKGDYSQARECWARLLKPRDWKAILEAMVSRKESPALWEAIVHERWRKVIGLAGDEGQNITWMFFPDAEMKPEDVWARLVLVSILEGSLDRGLIELKTLEKLFPQAEGRLAGQKGKYLDILTSLAEQERQSAPTARNNPWQTFAGSASRNGQFSKLLDVGAPLWEQSLGEPTTPGRANPIYYRFSQRRIAENPDGPLLSYHPVLFGQVMLIAKPREILAYDVRTGKPAWGDSAQIFVDNESSVDRMGYRQSLGAPRFTLTVHENFIFARMGISETSEPSDNPQGRSQGITSLICLDLSAQGRLVWRIPVPEDRFSFDGAPLADGENVYVVLRKSDVRPQIHVACFEATTGKLRWRRMIAGGDTPSHGQVSEITHNLLTLHQDRLYVNTNVGAIASLDKRDGTMCWVHLYERAAQVSADPRGDEVIPPGGHYYRDLNPCVYDRGKVIVAPADSQHIFALDAMTGAPLWRSLGGSSSAVHLLGVGKGYVIAGGRNLWWFHAETGKVAKVFPEVDSSLSGYGRGILTGEEIYWPTRQEILVFDQGSGELIKRIDLLSRGAEGGNLLIADGRLIISGTVKVQVLGEHAGPATHTASRETGESKAGIEIPPKEKQKEEKDVD